MNKLMKSVIRYNTDAIDAALAGAGMIGAVTGRKIIRNRLRPTRVAYTWTAGAEPSAPVVRPLRIWFTNTRDLDRVIMEALGIGTYWEIDKAGLTITAPLPGVD